MYLLLVNLSNLKMVDFDSVRDLHIFLQIGSSNKDFKDFQQQNQTIYCRIEMTIMNSKYM